MSRHLSRRRRTFLVSAAAIAASASLLGSSAHASMAVSLRLANGATSMYIGGDQTNTDIPIQVWATVTGAQTINPVPVPGNYASNPQVTSGAGNYFDGLQYLYYNVLNSNSAGTYITGGIDTAAGQGPTLNATLGFAAFGSQAGAVQNIVGGVSVGSTSSITSVAKPRAAHAVFDNQVIYNQSGGVYQSLGNDGTNIVVSGNTVRFLVQTINFKPTAYASATNTTFTLASPSAAFTASASTDLSPANWFENVTNQTGGTNGQPSGGTNVSGSPSIGTSVTIQDTLAGDSNLDGSVGPADFLTLRKNYNVVKTGGTWAQGDYNHDGAVGPADFLLLRPNYNKTTPAPSAAVAALRASTATSTSTSARSATLVVSALSTSSAMPNVVTTSPQTPPSGQVQLVVYTGTGDAQLVFNNASLLLYNITSVSGELVPANWKPISGQSGYSQYGFFSLSNSSNGLSESTFGSGPTLISGSIDLGNIFSLNVPAASRDLVFQEADNNGTLYTVDVDYVSSAPEPTSLVLCGAACAGLLGRRRRMVATRTSPL